MGGSRDAAQQLIAANAAALAQHGSASMQAVSAALRKQWWNLPAKYAAARRIEDEVLAAYPGHDDAGDAMRHAELSRRMAAEIDPLTSAVAGLAHEAENSISANLAKFATPVFQEHAGRNWHGQRWPERDMDMHNNFEGIRAAMEGRPVDPSRLQVRPAGGPSDLTPYGGRPGS